MSSDLSYIALDLRTLAVPVADLHEDPANARTGHDVDRIMASLTQYGQRKPIVVNRKQANKVEAGNGMLAAARRLGWSHIAAVFVDDDPNTATAYGIADNRTGDLSTWDVATLKDLADSLPDDLFTGFETAELNDLIAEWEREQPREEARDAEPQIDRATELQAQWQVQPGELFEIGAHRLICGDCTDAATVAKLMGGEKAGLNFSDPPYGVERDEGFGGFGGFGKPIARRQYSDDWDSDRPAKEHFDFMLSYAENSIFWGGNFFADILPRSTHWIAWDKNNTMPTFGDCELAWTSFKRKSVKKYEITYNGLIGKESERFHPTQKPLKLYEACLSDYAEDGQIVIDFYAGSGTTGIACQNLNRRARMVELSPAYCAVILQRFTDAFPGLEIRRYPLVEVGIGA